MSGNVPGKAGRPRKYQTPEDFAAKAQEYFDLVRANPQDMKFTVTGLALHLGFSSRKELFDYAGYDGFEEVVGQARLVIEGAYEARLHGTTPTGAIFALTNMGWKNEKYIDHKTTDGSMTPKSSVSIDTSKLTTDQLAALYGAIKVAPNEDKRQ